MQTWLLWPSRQISIMRSQTLNKKKGGDKLSPPFDQQKHDCAKAGCNEIMRFEHKLAAVLNKLLK